MEGLPFTPYEGKEPYIFVSYAHKDKDDVFPIIKRLHGMGYRIWYDEGIRAGKEWLQEVDNHIVAANTFLVFLSPTAVERRNVRSEINRAFSQEIPILGIDLTETELKYGLALHLDLDLRILSYKYTPAEFQAKLLGGIPEETKGPASIDWPPVGSQYSFGGYPWRVLAVDKLERKVLLLSEEILAQRPYNDNSAETTWADCTLKEYLNEDFYDSFSPADKARILLTRNDNPDNPEYDTDGGEQTKDYVFLLSVQDVLQYFPGLKLNKSGWHYEADERLTAKYQNKSSLWWLRSPGDSQSYAAGVDCDGTVSLRGVRVSYGSVGVRPALWLNLKS